MVEGLPLKGSPPPLGSAPTLAEPEVVVPVSQELAAPVFIGDTGRNKVEQVGYK